MEKIQFKNNEAPYLSAENLNQLQTNIETAISEVVESGSNENGEWTKWADGTMICTLTKTFTGVDITTVWGSLYESSSALNLGNLPQTFIEPAKIFIFPNRTFFIERSNAGNQATQWGSFYPVRPVSESDFNLGVDCIAIGKWK